MIDSRNLSILIFFMKSESSIICQSIKINQLCRSTFHVLSHVKIINLNTLKNIVTSFSTKKYIDKSFSYYCKLNTSKREFPNKYLAIYILLVYNFKGLYKTIQIDLNWYPFLKLIYFTHLFGDVAGQKINNLRNKASNWVPTLIWIDNNLKIIQWTRDIFKKCWNEAFYFTNLTIIFSQKMTNSKEKMLYFNTF